MINKINIFVFLIGVVWLTTVSADWDLKVVRPWLRQLCHFEKDARQIPRITLVQTFIYLLEEGASTSADGPLCDENVAEAIKRLKPVLEPVNKYACSPQTIDAIVSYWNDYISADAKLKQFVPEQVERFFNAYVLQVSYRCKQILIGELRAVTRDEEFGPTQTDWIIVSNRVLDMIPPTADIRLENLIGVVQNSTSKGNEKTRVEMNLLAQDSLDRLLDRCEKKFKPIYDVLITPIIRLAAIGINYESPSISTLMRMFEKDRFYRSWFAAVLNCEASSAIVPVDEKGEQSSWYSADAFAKDIEYKYPRIITTPNSHQIKFYINNLVLNENDAYLMKTLSAAPADSNEVEEIKESKESKKSKKTLCEKIGSCVPFFKTTNRSGAPPKNIVEEIVSNLWRY